MLHKLIVLKNIVKKDGFIKTIHKFFTMYRFGINSIYERKYTELVSSIENESKIAVLFNVVHYEKHMNQRSVNLAQYLSDKGYIVFFVVWQWSPHHVIKNACEEVDENIYCIPLLAFEPSILSNFSQLLLFPIIPSDTVINLVQRTKLSNAKIIYDIMDDWEEFNHIGMADWYCGVVQEEKLIYISDLVSAVSPRLINKFSHVGKNIILSPNGYSIKTVGNHCNICKKQTSSGKIIIGYFGHLTSKWINWDLIFALSNLPNVEVQIIGNGLFGDLKNRVITAGIKYHGVIDSNKLFSYVKNWHIGLVPFNNSLLSNAVDPIKIYEYIYYGLPVLVTGIDHLEKYPRTIVLDEVINNKLLQTSLDILLGLSIDEAELQTFLANSTWQKRFDDLLSAVI